MNPSWRKPAGMFAILALILVWVVLIASFAGTISQLHWTLQAIVYLVTGIVWILPLKPLLRWMELGTWR
ncbi:DUF2842 domain-containing protein [Sphingomonas qomolangmaensis]|uniref:DUF2842 domain-containing protein n=1 Tax=Sphingomonas qomolangmaensis TaxID=2918765 RepID=A0ABY5LEZ2_9SPHN|nr:DUF2842 domain-containing protein [Sphingomonas qomolangmaensis]UUL83281.1 DUF2842 domain-containing protein [Sphingomonas qomolangmaensis]